jgi:hypothetical protein
LPPEETKRLVRKVSELFPDATSAQVSLVERHLESCDVTGAEGALEEYAARNERLFPSRLIEMLRECSSARRDWRQDAWAQRQARQREERDIDYAFSKMSDEELSRHVQAIEQVRPDISSFIKGKDPRQSEWLRHLIYDRIKSA